MFCVSILDVQIPFSYFICGQCIDIRGDMSNPWTRPCWLFKSKRIILENLIFYFKNYLRQIRYIDQWCSFTKKNNTCSIAYIPICSYMKKKIKSDIIIFNRKRICIIYSKILFSFDIRNIFKMWGKKRSLTTVGPTFSTGKTFQIYYHRVVGFCL